jgi:biotin synthase
LTQALQAPGEPHCQTRSAPLSVARIIRSFPMPEAALRPRQDWTREEIAALFDLPLPDLMFRALSVRDANWPDGRIQKSQLLSIKTGGCPEDCGYCSQSSHFKTGLAASKLMDVDAVVAEAKAAKANGADRFCMGAAWRSLKDRDMPKVCSMISAVRRKASKPASRSACWKTGRRRS